jgi:hypothetical protein
VRVDDVMYTCKLTEYKDSEGAMTAQEHNNVQEIERLGNKAAW